MKYNNKKVELDGIKFDSKAEAQRYCELKLLQKAGKITDLQAHVKFELIPKNKFECAVKYIADFTYTENGILVVEDVKSKPTKTKDYIIKRKLMLHVHGIRVKEVIG